MRRRVRQVPLSGTWVLGLRLHFGIRQAAFPLRRNAATIAM